MVIKGKYANYYGGYTGKMLRINLTTGKITPTSSAKYCDYIGNFGMGIAIYWDLVASKGNPLPKAYDPENIVSITTSAMSGTGFPGTGRCEVTGKSPTGYPHDFFSRSGFGGHFSANLKMAGWDAVVIEGRSDKPVYIYIENAKVEIRDAGHLWGKFTNETHQAIYEDTGLGPRHSWEQLSDGTATTQAVAVLSCGPSGEQMCAESSLMHEGGHGAGNGGMGAVFGSKNLKAIAVIGTGSVKINNPEKLLELQAERQSVIFQMDDPSGDIGNTYGNDFGAKHKVRAASGCHGCPRSCKAAHDTFPGMGSQIVCMNSYGYRKAAQDFIKRREELGKPPGNDSIPALETEFYGALSNNRWGVNSSPWAKNMDYNWLYNVFYKEKPEKFAQLAPGFDMSDYGSKEWIERFHDMVTYRRNELGKALAHGWKKGAHIIGEGDVFKRNWVMPMPYWHGASHHRDPRAQYHWGLATILHVRDHNEHDLESHQSHLVAAPDQKKAFALMDELGQQYPSANGIRFKGKDFVADDDNLYTEGVALLVQYYRHRNNVFTQGLSFCCYSNVNTRWLSHQYRPETYWTRHPDLEVEAYNAVTGSNETYADLMLKGRRIANLMRSIHVMEGLHRDMETFEDYIFDTKLNADVKIGDYQVQGGTAFMTDENGKFARIWPDRSLNRNGVEKSKDYYFNKEGWDLNTGWPTRKSLEELDLGHAADALEKAGKLGRG